MMKKYTLSFLLSLAFIWVSNLNAQTIFEEGFDNDTVIPSDWIVLDMDGDGYNWELVEDQGGAHSGNKYVHSLSYDQINSPLTPNNYLISPMIDLSNSDGLIELSWWIAPSASNPVYKEEHYKVMISTTNSSDTTSFIINAFEETLSQEQEGWEKRVIDISDYIGDTVFVAWIHYNCTDEDRLKLDDILVEKNASVTKLVQSKTIITVSPNPVNTSATLKFTLNTNENVSYTINDILGRKIIEKNLGKRSGFNKLNINTESLNSGIYYIRLKHDNEIAVAKFVKQ